MLQETFEKMCELLEPEMSHASFSTWIEPLKLIQIENGVATIEVLNEMTRNIINGKYHGAIIEALRQVTGKTVTLELLTVDEIDKFKPFSEKEKEPEKKSRFNPKYTFDNFIVGDNNKYTHAFCLAVAEAPSQMYNPLFLYGGVGLGKTHLMHAIGNFILQEYPEKDVLYVTAEEFTNDYVRSIKNNTVGEDFRKKYRHVDVLLIDDIQFLCGKDKSQEEFFHTYNALRDMNSQIICTSDKSPRELDLEERMRSRFEWGLITDIKKPDLETRIATLSKKAESENVNVSDDVLLYIANKIDSNVRELEGSLTRVMAFSTLSGKKITLELAEEALKDYFHGKKRAVTGELIIEMVCTHFGIKKDDLCGKRRDNEVTVPRHIAMYLCRELTDLSLPSIGKLFGNRHHTTVMNGCENIKDESQHDVAIKTVVNDLKRRIEES